MGGVGAAFFGQLSLVEPYVVILRSRTLSHTDLGDRTWGQLIGGRSSIWQVPVVVLGPYLGSLVFGQLHVDGVS